MESARMEARELRKRAVSSSRRERSAAPARARDPRSRAMPRAVLLPPRHPRSRAALSALLCAAPLALGALAEASPERALLAGLEAGPCLAGELVGPAGCPGCGLARGTALLAQGEIGAALALQPAALVLALGCAIGLGLNLWALARGRRAALHPRLASSFPSVFALALAASWLGRML